MLGGDPFYLIGSASTIIFADLGRLFALLRLLKVGLDIGSLVGSRLAHPLLLFVDCLWRLVAMRLPLVNTAALFLLELLLVVTVNCDHLLPLLKRGQSSLFLSTGVLLEARPEILSIADVGLIGQREAWIEVFGPAAMIHDLILNLLLAVG